MFEFYVIRTVPIVTVGRLPAPTNALIQVQFITTIKTATCFGTGCNPQVVTEQRITSCDACRVGRPVHHTSHHMTKVDGIPSDHIIPDRCLSAHCL